MHAQVDTAGGQHLAGRHITLRLPLLQFSIVSLAHLWQSADNLSMLKELKYALCSIILSQPLEVQCGALVCSKCLRECMDSNIWCYELSLLLRGWSPAAQRMVPCCLVSSHVRPASSAILLLLSDVLVQCMKKISR